MGRNAFKFETQIRFAYFRHNVSGLHREVCFDVNVLHQLNDDFCCCIGDTFDFFAISNKTSKCNLRIK